MKVVLGKKVVYDGVNCRHGWEVAWVAYKVKYFWLAADRHPFGVFEAVGQLIRQQTLHGVTAARRRELPGES